MAGEAFWLLDDSALVPFPESRKGVPRLILARPDRMRHVIDNGKLSGWVYTDGASRQYALLTEQVIHLKQWNPYDEWRGLGEYEAARIDVEITVANTKFLKALAESNGDQGVYIVAKNGIPSDNQKSQIIAQLREKRSQQQRGIFRPVFLTGDISVEDPQVRSADAAFLESQRMSAEAIFVAFGVPPSMASKTASYSIGSASDYYRLILDTCQPEANEIAAAIAMVSERITGRSPLFTWFNWSSHPVLQTVRKESLDSFGKLCDRGMPPSAAGEYLDLALPRYEGDDVGYLPFSVSPIGGDMAAPVETVTPAPVVEDPVTLAIRALSQPVTKAPGSKLWLTHMKARQGSITLYKSAYTRALMKARGEVLRKIETKAHTAARSLDVTKAGAADLMFDLDEFDGTLKGFMRKAGQSALDISGSQLFKEIARDDPFIYPPAKALAFLKGRENLMTGVSQGVFDNIKGALEKGLNDGSTMTQLADLVRGEFNEMSRSRSITVAMTETAAAYGDSRQEAMNQAGIKFKEWLTSGGDNVRQAHMDAHGQTVGVDDTFVVGGEQLMHPGDESGSAGNVINCHCVAVSVEKGPE